MCDSRLILKFNRAIIMNPFCLLRITGFYAIVVRMRNSRHSLTHVAKGGLSVSHPPVAYLALVTFDNKMTN